MPMNTVTKEELDCTLLKTLQNTLISQGIVLQSEIESDVMLKVHLNFSPTQWP